MKRLLNSVRTFDLISALPTSSKHQSWSSTGSLQAKTSVSVTLSAPAAPSETPAGLSQAPADPDGRKACTAVEKVTENIVRGETKPEFLNFSPVFLT